MTDDYAITIPKPRSLLAEIAVVRQQMRSRYEAELELLRARRREMLMDGNRRFWTKEMAEREEKLR